MRRKRNLTSGEIVKHKARLNLHGGMQEYGVNYYETHAQVVTCFAIRLMIVFSILFNQAMRQIDFVMAFPQAPIEMDMYMEQPKGIETKHGNSKDHVLKLLQNIYGKKQAGRVWNHHLAAKLLQIGFTQSLIDDCVFYRGDTIFIVYVDDRIFIVDNNNQIIAIIAQLQSLGLEIEDQGQPANYVGVNIKRLKGGGIEFTQRALIDSIIEDVGLKDTTTKPVPAKANIMQLAQKDQPRFTLDCDYRFVTGKLNYLAQTSRPELCMPPTRLPSTPHIQGCHMAKRSSTWSGISWYQWTLVSASLQIQAKVLSAIATPISLATGTRVMQHTTWAQQNQGVVGSSSTLDVP